MSKIKNLKNEHPEYDVNLIEIFKKFDPSATGKYVPFIMRRFDEAIANIVPDFLYSDEYKEYKKGGVEPKNTIDLYFTYLLWTMLGSENLVTLREFEKHINEKRIDDLDVQNYKTWEDINNGVFSANLKLKEKELQKQVKVIYDKNGWLILKPLSFAASLTYGAGTKWCTASKNNSNYFYDYCDRGSLTYIINRNNNFKVAMYINLYSKPLANNQKLTDITFWTAEDSNIDSVMLDLPSEIMSALRDLINDRTQCKPNKHFFSKTELKKTMGSTKELLVDAAPRHVYYDDPTVNGYGEPMARDGIEEAQDMAANANITAIEWIDDSQEVNMDFIREKIEECAANLWLIEEVPEKTPYVDGCKAINDIDRPEESE